MEGKKFLVWLKEPKRPSRHVWMSFSPENLEKVLKDDWIISLHIASDMAILCAQDMIESDKIYNCTIGSQQFFGTIILIGTEGMLPYTAFRSYMVTYTDFKNCELTAKAMKRVFPELMEEG